MDYLHGELKFGGGKTYWATRDIGSKWIWTHQPIDASKQPIVNSGVDLAQAMEQDANLRVLVLNGYFDLATPFSATEYMMAHLGVPPNVASRIQMRYYKTGHMIYVNPVALKRLKNDLDAFIDSTAPP
jgi:carboxypeptidase C (cathepsin A)